MDADELKHMIIRSLREQGFRIQGGAVLPPASPTKDAVRSLHSTAVRHRVDRAEKYLRSRESRLLTRVARGTEVIPERIAPRLVEVQPNSEDEVFFRYASLHWSIPVSSGYGRRLRFLVVDEHNQKVIGLLGLGDPVFNLAARDRWVGWDKETRRTRLQHVMDAFILGAIPPYSALLCGKLVAMLAASNEVRRAFSRKYRRRRSLIRERTFGGQLAMLTTTSAFGRSSLYNRVDYCRRPLYLSVGLTRGSGEFHFSNSVYTAMQEYAAAFCEPTAKQAEWGQGFRNRREVVRKCLASLGLPTDWVYHGVQREVFVVPLAGNTSEFLRGDTTDLEWYNHPSDGLCAWFRERWLLPRAQRDKSYLEFDPEEYRLWQRRS